MLYIFVEGVIKGTNVKGINHCGVYNGTQIFSKILLPFLRSSIFWDFLQCCYTACLKMGAIIMFASHNPDELSRNRVPNFVKNVL